MANITHYKMYIQNPIQAKLKKDSFFLLSFVEFPQSDVLAIVCSDNFIHPNSQTCDCRSSALRNSVDEDIF